MKFVVLIACHSNSVDLCNTLDSISSAAVPNELESIVVIENGDEMKLQDKVYRFKDKLPIEYYFTDEKGKSIALNIAIGSYIPDDRFILFTDDDVRVNSDWLIRYANAFIAYGKGSFFGSAFEPEYEQLPDPALVSSLPPSARGMNDEAYQKKPDRAFLGFNWAAHKEDLVSAGLFNPDFGPGSRTGATGQEAEMQDRLRKNGVKPVLVENNLVWHKVPADKCTYEWTKKRAERTGRERFYRKKKRVRWLITQLRNIGVSGLKSITGNKRERYRCVMNTIAAKSFIAQAFKRKGLSTK